MHSLNLQRSHGFTDAAKAFAEGDHIGFVYSTIFNNGDSVGDCLGLVGDNWMALKDRGIFEKCLLLAYSEAKTARYATRLIKQLFDVADRKLLLAAGDPPPQVDRMEIYRGVAGARAIRKVRGFSWTLSLDTACWFASRMNFEDPAVYVASIKPTDAYAYLFDRNEDEVLALPSSSRRLALSLDEIKKAAERHLAARETPKPIQT